MQWNSSRAIQNSKGWCYRSCNQYVSNLEDSAVATGLEKVNPHPIPKNASTKECSNQQTVALISHASKGAWLKILHARLQRYTNQELPDIQTGFRKGRGIWDQIANIHWIIEKPRELQKNIYLCFVDVKAFDYVDHNKLWKALREMGISDHLTYFLRNLYVHQEETIRTLYGTTDYFRTEKGVWKGCLLSPYLLNLYAEHIMRNARLDELQTGIKIGRRNINDLR